jgi:hypothetical protein
MGGAVVDNPFWAHSDPERRHSAYRAEPPMNGVPGEAGHNEMRFGSPCLNSSCPAKHP